MKLYAAAVHASGLHKTGQMYARLSPNEMWQRNQIQYLLESYHYTQSPTATARIRRDNVRVFLDSGAFSAFSKGVDIDLDGYIRYVQENDDIIEQVDGVRCFSVLDGIGDPLKTYQNQCYMEQKGVTPLPCFHYGEDERYLEHYISKYDYITLGGMVPISRPQLYHWLDRIWDRYLVDGSGRPRVRVHGFGLTTFPLVERYPWFSVDSSSWAAVSRNGGVLMYPDARVIHVSVHASTRKEDGKHIDTLPEIMRKEVERRLEEQGVDLFRIRQTYLARWAYNLHCYRLLGELYTKEHEWRFTKPQPELWDA